MCGCFVYRLFGTVIAYTVCSCIDTVEVNAVAYKIINSTSVSQSYVEQMAEFVDRKMSLEGDMKILKVMSKWTMTLRGISIN